MTALQAALLGVVQGLTEFLPISSSAHLILARALLGWDAGDVGLAFDVACHVGTLLAVLAFFRRDLIGMVIAVPDAMRNLQHDEARLVRNVVIGTIPIVIVGLLFADVLTASLRTPAVAAVALTVGAGVMILAERRGSLTRSDTTLSGFESLGLGVAQAAALIPGVSRSGAVLTVAMLFGLKRERAARFAFLLGIPAIVAAAGRQAIELAGHGAPSGTAGLFAIGIVSSGLVGYLTVKFFIRYLASNSLNLFAAYRLVLAACILLALVR